MPEEKHKIFDLSPADPSKTAAESREHIENEINYIRKWLKGKHFFECKIVEEDGVVTFLYTEKEEAATK